MTTRRIFTCMKDIIEKYNSSQDNGNNSEQSPVEMQVLKLKDIDGLTLNELIRLEKILEKGLYHVLEGEGIKIMKEIAGIHEKGQKMTEEEALLHQKVLEIAKSERTIASLSLPSHNDKYSSGSVPTSNSEYPEDFGDLPDTLLKLGLKIILMDEGSFWSPLAG